MEWVYRIDMPGLNFIVAGIILLVFTLVCLCVAYAWYDRARKGKFRE